jgi:hypothetical protein
MISRIAHVATGSDPSWIQRIEAGGRRVDVVEFIEFAKAANRDPMQLLGRVLKGVGKMRMCNTTERSKMTVSRFMLAIVLVAAFVIGCAKQPLTEVDTQNSQGVVLSVSIAPAVLNQCSRSIPTTPDGYWEPTERNVQALETLLPAYLRARSEASATRVLERLSQYKRQYAGFLRGGHKTIYVNLFLSESREQWRSDVVLVCDGGIRVWGVEFDTTSNTFVHVAYNGVA